MANRWGNNGNNDFIFFFENFENNDFIFLGSKITADGETAVMKLKKYLLLGRKAVTNLDKCIKKQKHYFANKDPDSQSYGFSSSHEWMWTIKKAEHQRIGAFELWCWRRLLRVLWTARRSYQSILKEISPECSLEGLKLKLKLQYFGNLICRTDSFEKTLMLGKIEGRRRKGQQRIRWLCGITDSWTWTWANSRRWWGTGKPGVLKSRESQSGIWLGDWTTTTCITYLFVYHAAFLMDWRQPEGRIYLSHHCITSARDNVWHVTNS